jgi:hypothetical protein
MAIDTTRPDTPGWWLARLLTRLSEKSANYDLLDSYYAGTNTIPVSATKTVRDSYQRLMAVSKTNFAELIVEAVRERMMPVGFKTGAANDELGDKEAWRVWQANSLDADSSLVHAASLSMGMGYVIVGPVDEEIGAPLITPEDPREVIAETDPRRRRKVVAGLKVYRDDVAGEDRAYLYLPGVVYRASRTAPLGSDETDPISPDASGWEWTGKDEYAFPLVPVVPFPNRPKLGHQITRGEYETHLPLLNRIDYTVLQRVEIATLQAYRQRAVKGIPLNDEQGNPIDYDDIFSADPGALWQLPETAEMWESGQVDLGPLRQAIRDDVQDVAAVTRTPLFYLTPEATNGSAEGASLAREGLIFKTRDRLVEAGEAWEQVQSLAFRFMGDEQRANRVAMEIMWAPPERWSLAERADAATKAINGGLSRRAVLEDVWQKTPTQIEQIEADTAAEALMAQGVAAAAQLVTGATGTGGEPAAR